MRETSPAGPFDEWPLGRGFDQFYGFMNGAEDHYYPQLIRDNHAVPPPATPEEGYHLTEDLVDRSIGYISDHVAHAPHRPFFLYFPLGAAHAPHHAPAEFMEAVKGRYDEGWHVIREQRYRRQLEMGVIPPDTELPPGNPDVPAWESLSEQERRIAVRFQEAYAAFIEHTDQQLGRLFDFLERSGQVDETLIIITSDNGAAMEGGRLGAFSRIRFFNDMDEVPEKVLDSLDQVGGPRADSHYATGWAQASNTPLRWYKYHTHGGGIRDPLIVYQPGRMADPGAILDQFHHIIDIAPTIYEVSGVTPGDEVNGIAQLPIHGESLAYTFDEPAADSVRRVQYFEMFGNRAIWADGWKAVTRHFAGDAYDDSEWELYHLDEDFSESRNLAAEEPERLRELVELWRQEADRYDVLPLDDRSVELYRSPPPSGSPLLRSRFDYYPPVSHVEASTAPPFGSASRYRIEASVSGSPSGVLVAYGNSASGFVLYADSSELRYEYNAAGEVTTASVEMPTSEEPLDLGLEFTMQPDGTAIVQLYAGSSRSAEVTVTTPLRFLALAGMDIGGNFLSPISTSYAAPAEFEGRIERLTVFVDRPPHSEADVLDD